MRNARVAPVVFHVSVDELPAPMVVGDALIVATGNLVLAPRAAGMITHRPGIAGDNATIAKIATSLTAFTGASPYLFNATLFHGAKIRARR